MSWPPWVKVWGWASYRFLPFTVFSFFFLHLPFCFSRSIVHLRCTSEGGSQSRCLTRPRILSLCGIVRERLLLCRVVVTAKWVVSCTRITCIQPLSRCSLTLLASSFVSESVIVVFSLFSPSFFNISPPFFFGLLAISYPLVSLPFCISLVVCICLHPDALSSVVPICVLLYQSAAFVFLEGSRVNEGFKSSQVVYFRNPSGGT